MNNFNLIICNLLTYSHLNYKKKKIKIKDYKSKLILKLINDL